MSPLLSVRELRVSYHGPAAPVRALDGVDLTVGGGQTVAVVGESGAGKSTLALGLLGLLPPAARTLGGEIRLGGRELLALDDRELRAVRGREIAFIPQDPGTALNPVVPVGVQVAEALRIHRLADRAAARSAAADLLDTAGLPAGRATNYPHELSGGMRQRVLIAIALAGRPKVIVADEPTSALDVVVQARLLDHLAELTAESGTSVVLITHDLGIAAERAEHIVVMYRGRSVESGPAESLLARPRHSHTRLLVESAPSLNSARLTAATPPVAVPRQPLLTVSGLAKTFAGPGWRGRHRRTAVAGVDFTVDRGETLALVGESGAGKSTVARLLVRLEEPTAGGMRFDGAEVAELRGAALRRFRRRVQLIFQDPFACLNPRFTVAELLDEPLRAFKLGDRAARWDRVREVAGQVALSPALLGRRPGELSGGQCQRVAIARAIAVQPDLLVCDEPASSLDTSVQAQLLRLLVRLQAELGLSYVFITHDLAVVRQIADRVAVLRNGRIVESGPVDEVFVTPADPYTRELLSAVPRKRRTTTGVHDRTEFERERERR
ncbi:dipeptide ABC transporter ATP-binding protein [Amycolatopsis cihanbeyliensis]|uniref:Peptide/nickel transport system ATP-binding protein n=1 Tax=Amycolatopsis cihanbeyliensis TaxID=1128664 RepID=A0A542DI48_AMYCI|nr:ABC transporter ATP-binding protein [Amycolatopsis cihanbeyliensis]TQJ02772.1 peptide/nickel transport system ATP-binding protein [Amycolatopsis cihanbeyliensis]